MRIKQSTSFPHPLLSESTGDYGSKLFQMSLEVQENAGAGSVLVRGTLSLDDESVVDLIRRGEAAAGLMIHCQDTYLDTFETYELGDIELDLSKGNVRGKVHVRGAVVALTDGVKLTSPAINSEFPGESRSIGAGDLVALTREVTFEAGLEKLAPMESIFRLTVQDDLAEGIFDLDLEGESIGILVAPCLYQFLSLLRERPAKDALLSALYLPVVMSVLAFMQNESAYADRRWHSVMTARCNSEGIDVNAPTLDFASTAQRLLAAPLDSFRRAFETMEGS